MDRRRLWVQVDDLLSTDRGFTSIFYGIVGYVSRVLIFGFKLNCVSPRAGQTSHLEEGNPAFEVHHQGHHNCSDGHLGQAPVNVKVLQGLFDKGEVHCSAELVKEMGTTPEKLIANEVAQEGAIGAAGLTQGASRGIL